MQCLAQKLSVESGADHGSKSQHYRYVEPSRYTQVAAQRPDQRSRNPNAKNRAHHIGRWHPQLTEGPARGQRQATGQQQAFSVLKKLGGFRRGG